mgnify:CR=1 FL=1
MNYLTVENLSKSYGELTLFENLSFSVHKDQKIAFVAKNGTGKTSILNILSGEDEADSGTVTYRKGIAVSYLSQDPKLDKNLKDEDLKKYWIKRLNLAPSNISGFETCASKSIGCANACLHEAGNPVFMPQKTLGRVNRSLLYFKDRAKFLSMITREIRNHEILCKTLYSLCLLSLK